MGDAQEKSTNRHAKLLRDAILGASATDDLDQVLREAADEIERLTKIVNSNSLFMDNARLWNANQELTKALREIEEETEEPVVGMLVRKALKIQESRGGGE